MRSKLILLLLLIVQVALAQDKNHNYVKETLFLDGGSSAISNVNYYDGLGNLQETISTASGTSDNTCTFKFYDSKGREGKSYYPTPTSNGLKFVEFHDFVELSKHYYNDSFAFKQNDYDSSDRIIRESIAGEKWHYHDAHNLFQYTYNTTADKVIRYACDPLLEKGYYPAGCLEKDSEKDADGNEVTTFKDLNGNILLERRNLGDTYFVYDHLGQLRFILSPKYQEKGDLASYAYQYEYDRLGNLIRKTFPGAKYIQYWYDKEGHLAYEQDSQLREQDSYRFHMYDTKGREVIIGTTDVLCTYVQNVEMLVNYTSQEAGLFNTGYKCIVPALEDTLNKSESYFDKVYYYDSYNFLSGYYKNDLDSLCPTSRLNANGLLAGSIVVASNGNLLFAVNEYDTKGRLISSSKKGLDGLISKVTNNYSLTDKLLESNAEIDVKYGDKLKLTQTNSYSTRNDLLAGKSITLSHGNGTEVSTFLKYEYDATNRLSKIIRPDKVGTVSYSYDVHGWPVNITTDSFKETIYYSDGIGTPCYNGDISSMKWSNSNYDRVRGYKFQYDKLNRLVSGEYGEGESLEEAKGNFNEAFSYDLNGNITSLERCGKKQDASFGIIDKLSVSLLGNQISSVSDVAEKLLYEGALDFKPSSDGTANYRYNDFGALIGDTGRGITMITYDNFRNPIRIQFANGNVTEYIYSPEGEKLRTIYYTAMPNIHVADGDVHVLTSSETQSVETLDYLLGGTVMLKNGRIDKFLFEGGYAKAFQRYSCIVPPQPPSSKDATQEDWERYEENLQKWRKANSENRARDNFTFYYYNKDHLGNNREVIDMTGNVCQTTNYYPYGTPFCNQAVASEVNFQPFKYNGKQFDMMHGLDAYDYGVRQYNPIVPTWDRIDPLCESYGYMTPYNYCLDNPVNTTDQNGEGPISGALIGGGVELASHYREL